MNRIQKMLCTDEMFVSNHVFPWFSDETIKRVGGVLFEMSVEDRIRLALTYIEKSDVRCRRSELIYRFWKEVLRMSHRERLGKKFSPKKEFEYFFMKGW